MTPTPLADREARERIRHDLQSTLAVEAAAGTGKTTELVARIVNVLASGLTTVDRIVAVTFTEKAAGELKLRLRTELERARQQSSAGRATGGALDNALARLEEAHVATIHGFCAELLRERPVEAGVDPRFQMLTERQAERVYADVFTRWLHEQLENPGPGVKRALRRPLRRDGFGPPRPGASDGPSSDLRRAGWVLADWRDFPAPWTRRPFAREAAIDGLVGALHVFAELAAAPASVDDKLYLSVRPALQLSDRIRHEERLTRRRDYDGLEAQFVALNRGGFKRPRSGWGTWYRPGVARRIVLEAHGELMTFLTPFVREADAELSALLQRELVDTVVRYQQAKAALGALDFLDLLVRARDLVRDHIDVRRAFQERFTHIFVDEFQDTDPVQAELLLLLAGQDAAESRWRQVVPVAGKLFIVGDPKQSIYRFRRADVGIYQEVRDLLTARGAAAVSLTSNFRSVPGIQRAVNRAFSRVMTGDRATRQASYVPLAATRPQTAGQPSVVALPVPDPYRDQRVEHTQINRSLPDAVGAFIHWLVTQSGWRVTEREQPGQGVPVAARHVCILFRRFDHLGADMTRPYVEALEARGIAHLLVGGKSFHDRDEVETLRTALSAVEWPDDELVVFGTLHGTLFALPDELLFEYRQRVGRWHPFDRPSDLPASLATVSDALIVLRDLHLGRNHRPVAETIMRLLDATRAHASFAFRKAGEQALANVLYMAELGRQYEANGGMSFRGFVEQLRSDASSTKAEEAPVVEEGSEGVRIMTVHRAKGLEFPVVVLADMTAPLKGWASRHIETEAGLCAVRLAGCAPWDLLDHEADEEARDTSEAVRVAYVAATRARDLLVVPALADGAFDTGWLAPLNEALYPAKPARRDASAAAGCPAFGPDGVHDRAWARPADSVAPGAHDIPPAADGDEPFAVVWWDPSVLDLDVSREDGVRGEDLVAKDAPPLVVEESLARYRAWSAARASRVRAGRLPARVVRTVRQRAADEAARGVAPSRDVVFVELHSEDGSRRRTARVGGARFGALVHAVLASMPLDGNDTRLGQLADVHARILGASREEASSARELVADVLRHPLLQRARDAARGGRCRRELPVLFSDAYDVCEGIVDLAFEEDAGWTVVDFKTDRGGAADDALYGHQVALYAEAVARASGRPASAYVLRI